VRGRRPGAASPTARRSPVASSRPRSLRLGGVRGCAPQAASGAVARVRRAPTGATVRTPAQPERPAPCGVGHDGEGEGYASAGAERSGGCTPPELPSSPRRRPGLAGALRRLLQALHRGAAPRDRPPGQSRGALGREQGGGGDSVVTLTLSDHGSLPAVCHPTVHSPLVADRDSVREVHEMGCTGGCVWSVAQRTLRTQSRTVKRHPTRRPSLRASTLPNGRSPFAVPRAAPLQEYGDERPAGRCRARSRAYDAGATLTGRKLSTSRNLGHFRPLRDHARVSPEPLPRSQAPRRRRSPEPQRVPRARSRPAARPTPPAPPARPRRPPRLAPRRLREEHRYRPPPAAPASPPDASPCAPP
jgi:hypothetical protein